MSVDLTGKEDFQAGTKMVGRIFNTPVTVWKNTWIPVTQLITWLIFTRRSAKKKPSRSAFYGSAEGFCKMAVTLGAEWCHNLSRAFAADKVGKPMDQMRIQMGMPRCIYNLLNDPEVSLRQHIARALGGPVFHLLMVPITALIHSISKPGSMIRDTAQTAMQTNLFLSSVSLLPIPGIDGGPILKWGLVEKGHTVKEADQVVRKTNGPLALFLGLFSSGAFLRKKILVGFFSGMLGLISLSIYSGWVKEEDVSI